MVPLPGQSNMTRRSFIFDKTNRDTTNYKWPCDDFKGRLYWARRYCNKLQMHRFPHRNQILGRESSKEEETFLKIPEYRSHSSIIFRSLCLSFLNIGFGCISSLHKETPRRRITVRVVIRGSQRDVVYLGWPITPSYMSLNRGGGGGGTGIISANEYSGAHGAQITFGDLTPYLTYA